MSAVAAEQLVAVIVPTLNESAYIKDCLESLLAQRGCMMAEIIVADGGSTDDTLAQVGAVARRDGRVRVVRNPAQIQSAGFNAAAAAAGPEATVLVRADAHVVYPQDFVACCLHALVTHDASSVVVPMRTVSRAGARFQRAVAAAQNSWLGNGGSAHRTQPRSGLVAHGHHAVFDRAFFNRIGGYDPNFSHNEDAEFDHRASMAGGRIWMCGQARVDYFPRGTVGGLARQYLRNGRGRARTLLTHRLRPAPRQLAPALLIYLLAISLALAAVWPALAGIPLLYGVACVAGGLWMAVRARDAWLLAAGPAAMIMHLGFACGFSQALWSSWAARRAQ